MSIGLQSRTALSNYNSNQNPGNGSAGVKKVEIDLSPDDVKLQDS